MDSASDADIVATTDTVVTVATAGAADIAINATGNIANLTTAAGTITANLCAEFDG
jgi:hypothetical protein